jgi:hypothetical protein
MIRPLDLLVIPQPGFRSNFFGYSDPTRSDRARYRIHESGMVEPINILCSVCDAKKRNIHIQI